MKSHFSAFSWGLELATPTTKSYHPFGGEWIAGRIAWFEKEESPHLRAFSISRTVDRLPFILGDNVQDIVH